MAPTRDIQQVQLEHVELSMVIDCFGDRAIVEVTLPEAIALTHLEQLSGISQQTILRDLPRPFFRIDCAGRFLLTGIVGDPKVRFTLRKAVIPQACDIVSHAVRELLGLAPVSVVPS